MKIDPAGRVLNEEDILDDATPEDLRESLPERQPRFVMYSCRLDHGDHVSYPMCLIFSTPRDCKTELMVLYAGTKLSLVKESGVAKVYELRDLEDLDEDWLRQKLLGR